MLLTPSSTAVRIGQNPTARPLGTATANPARSRGTLRCFDPSIGVTLQRLSLAGGNSAAPLRVLPAYQAPCHLTGLMGRGRRLQCPRAAFPQLSACHPLLPPTRVPTSTAQGDLCSPPRRRRGKRSAEEPLRQAMGQGSLKRYPAEPRRRAGSVPTPWAKPGPLRPCSSNARSPSLSYFIFSSGCTVAGSVSPSQHQGKGNCVVTATQFMLASAGMCLGRLSKPV